MTQSTLVESFAKSLSSLSEFDGTELLVLREDGVVVYSTYKGANEALVGALMTGAYLASRGLIPFFPGAHEEDFRLSFDTSSDGVYMRPFRFDGRDYCLGILFKKETNPGCVKNRWSKGLNKLVALLDGKEIFTGESKKKSEENALPTGNKYTKVTADKNDRKSYLFNDISDDEIESLFSSRGK